jgi:hypothetical protein
VASEEWNYPSLGENHPLPFFIEQTEASVTCFGKTCIPVL